MRFRLLALPTALLLAAGCSWFSPSLELRARVPEVPEHWRRAFPELRFQLACLEAGLPQPAALADLCPGGSAILRLPKRSNWPVLAYPRARGVRLPPAGGLFPLDLNAAGDTLELSWEHGPAAEVFQLLAREGFDLGPLNARRLLEEMRSRSGGDPYCLDLELLAGRLVSGQFRATDLRLRPARDVTLELAPGTWFLESPFRPARALEAGQALLLPAVPLGAHRLFAVEQPGGCDLFVGEREVFLLPLAPGD